MVVAKDKKVLDKLRFLSVQAKTDPLYYKHDEIGYNYRLTNIAAAFGTKQMDRIEKFIQTKKENYFNEDFLLQAPSQLAEKFPELQEYSDVIKIIDSQSSSTEKQIFIHANSIEQRAVVYLD